MFLLLTQRQIERILNDSSSGQVTSVVQCKQAQLAVVQGIRFCFKLCKCLPVEPTQAPRSSRPILRSRVIRTYPRPRPGTRAGRAAPPHFSAGALLRASGVQLAPPRAMRAWWPLPLLARAVNRPGASSSFKVLSGAARNV